MRCLTNQRVDRGRLVSCWILVAALVVSCTASESDSRSWANDITRRVVGLETTGCGHASPADGGGVLVRPDLVLTAAHVVAGSMSVSALGPANSTGESEPQAVPADVVAFDRDRDLALLRTHSPLVAGTLDVPVIGNVDGGDVIHIAGREPSRTATVVERTVIVADRVRGTERVRRLGYLLSTTTNRGDSGSGLFHRNQVTGDHDLVGLVFAVSTDDSTRTWAVAGSEIEAFLTDTQSADGDGFVCDPEESVLVPRES